MEGVGEGGSTCPPSRAPARLPMSCQCTLGQTLVLV